MSSHRDSVSLIAEKFTTTATHRLRPERRAAAMQSVELIRGTRLSDEKTESTLFLSDDFLSFQRFDIRLAEF